MKQTASVLRVLPDGRAELRVLRSAACGSCEGCAGCGAERQQLRITADNPIGAQTGERVVLESASGAVLRLAMAVYLLPILLFFAFYALGAATVGPPALWAVGGFLLSIPATVLLDRRLRRRQSVRYTITGRIGETECSAT